MTESKISVVMISVKIELEICNYICIKVPPGFSWVTLCQLACVNCSTAHNCDKVPNAHQGLSAQENSNSPGMSFTHIIIIENL